MKSDITRDTFAIRNYFSRVISQQGRVMLDADSNEQISILLHYLRTLAFDLIGPYAGPVLAPGFMLKKASGDALEITQGRYYIRGLLVENYSPCFYTTQPYHPLPANDPFAKAITDKKQARYWVYLDAWEQHITSIEDDRIREKALGGPDSCTRAKVVWQVKGVDMDVNAQQSTANKRREWLKAKLSKLQASQANKTPAQLARIQTQINKVNQQILLLDMNQNTCGGPLSRLLPRSDATMAARVDPGPKIADACVTSPDSKYRGAENQLYRVEVHGGGIAGEATIKWSRDNASAATAWVGTKGHDLEVSNARGFSAGNWVELSDDVTEQRGTPGLLARLSNVEGGKLSVDPDSVANSDALAWSETAIHPKVRRWDHFATEDTVLATDGSILIQETPIGTPDAAAKWLNLEDGIQIQFAEGGEYRSGDYWLITARVETGDIEWPNPIPDSPNSLTAHLPPNGVNHFFAPLGFVSWNASGAMDIGSCYCNFEPLSSCFNTGSAVAGVSLVSPNAQVMFPAAPPEDSAASAPKPAKKRQRASKKKAKKE